MVPAEAAQQVHGFRVEHREVEAPGIGEEPHRARPAVAPVPRDLEPLEPRRGPQHGSRRRLPAQHQPERVVHRHGAGRAAAPGVGAHLVDRTKRRRRLARVIGRGGDRQQQAQTGERGGARRTPARAARVERADGEVRHRRQQRQRITRREGLVKQQMSEHVRHDRGREPQKRGGGAPQHAEDASQRQDQRWRRQPRGAERLDE